MEISVGPGPRGMRGRRIRSLPACPLPAWAFSGRGPLVVLAAANGQCVRRLKRRS